MKQFISKAADFIYTICCCSIMLFGGWFLTSLLIAMVKDLIY